VSKSVNKNKKPIHSCFFKQILPCLSCFCCHTILGSAKCPGSVALFLASIDFLSATRKAVFGYCIDSNICYDRRSRIHEYLPHYQFKKAECVITAWCIFCCCKLRMRRLFICGTFASANTWKRRGHRHCFLCGISRHAPNDLSWNIVLVAILNISTDKRQPEPLEIVKTVVYLPSLAWSG